MVVCIAYTGPRDQDHQLPVSEVEYPFTLGQAFNLSYSSSAGAFSSTYGSGDGDAAMQFQFRFLEADGMTPVDAEAVPEPGTCALFGVALAGLALGKKEISTLILHSFATALSRIRTVALRK